jgi:hypothetical protein
MAKVALAALGLAACLNLGACASAGRASDEPSASIGPGIEAFAGRWQGSLWETAGSLYQGSSTLEVQLHEDGSWKGRIGAAPASGTARLEGDRLVVTGTAGAPDGPQLPVYVQLTGDDDRLWGQMAALFAGRRAPAMVDLRRQVPMQAP